MKPVISHTADSVQFRISDEFTGLVKSHNYLPELEVRHLHLHRKNTSNIMGPANPLTATARLL